MFGRRSRGRCQISLDVWEKKLGQVPKNRSGRAFIDKGAFVVHPEFVNDFENVDYNNAYYNVSVVEI